VSNVNQNLVKNVESKI